MQSTLRNCLYWFEYFLQCTLPQLFLNMLITVLSLICVRMCSYAITWAESVGYCCSISMCASVYCIDMYSVVINQT